MSEYIIHYKDAETLYEHTDFPFLLEEYLREPIVRCRDCVYMTNRKYKNSLEYQTCSYFDSEYAEVEPDGFCSWGKRKKADNVAKVANIMTSETNEFREVSQFEA